MTTDQLSGYDPELKVITTDQLSEYDPELVILDGFDDCIVGIVERLGQEDIVCYNANKIMEKLEAEGMDEAEALEWYEHNILGAYVGERTPCFLFDFTIYQ